LALAGSGRCRGRAVVLVGREAEQYLNPRLQRSVIKDLLSISKRPSEVGDRALQ